MQNLTNDYYYYQWVAQTHFQPELLIQGTCDQTALEQHYDALMQTLRHLKLQILAPVSQLCFLQWLHVEVGSTDLRQRSNTSILLKMLLETCQ